MNTLDGTIASRGYAYGQAFLLREGPLHLKRTTVAPDQQDAERDRLRKTLAKVRLEIGGMAEQASEVLDESMVAVFESYQVLLDDEELVTAIEELMLSEDTSAAWAVEQVMEEHAVAISQMESAYLRERA